MVITEAPIKSGEVFLLPKTRGILRTVIVGISTARKRNKQVRRMIAGGWTNKTSKRLMVPGVQVRVKITEAINHNRISSPAIPTSVKTVKYQLEADEKRTFHDGKLFTNAGLA